jgi:glucose/arabinose dehydrogenase
MTHASTDVRRLGLVASMVAALTAPVAAQQPAAPPTAAPGAAPGAAAPLPPGSALEGRPQSPGAVKLAPVTAPPLPTPGDKLPVAKLKAPPGFKVEVFAAEVPAARSIRIGDKGTVFVGARAIDKVHAITEREGKRQVKAIISGLHRPNGLAFHKGALFVAELSKVWRYDNIEDNLDNLAKPTLLSDAFPKDEAHGWKFIAIGPDEKLYVPVGAPGNINDPNPETHAHIRRMNLDGSGMEVFVRGVRNTVGFDWHPATKELYFTDNGRDWVSEDIPEDELNRVSASGKKHFGYPYCHQGNFRDPEFGWGHSCREFEPPVALLGPHTAALGMRFYTGDMFPAEYKNAIFIARRGSWNRTEKAGGDVVVAKLNQDGSVKSIEPFLTGFIENNNYVARPVDVEIMKDGSLLVSDDFNGAVYRISYSR